MYYLLCMKKTGKIMLFCSSYLLLFIVLLLNEIMNYVYLEPDASKIPVIIKLFIYVALIVSSIASIYIFKHSYSFGSFDEKTEISIKSISSGDQEIASYLITMVIPFIGDISSSISTNDWLDLATMVLFISFIAILYINSNLIVINPMLVMFGYSINKINFHHKSLENIEFEGVLLSKKEFDLTLLSKTTLVNKIDKDIFIIRRV